MNHLRTDRYKINAAHLSRKSQRIILRALEEVVEIEDGRSFYDADFNLQLFIRTCCEHDLPLFERPFFGGTQPLKLQHLQLQESEH